MKWLIPVVLATFALALAVWLPRDENDSAKFARAFEQEARSGEQPGKGAPRVDRDEEEAGSADREAGEADEDLSELSSGKSAQDAARSAPARAGRSRILIGKVVVFKHIRAETARDILRKTFPDPFEEESNTNVDEEHNALVFSAPAEMLRPVEQFLTKLDENGPAPDAATPDEDDKRPPRKVRSGAIRKAKGRVSRQPAETDVLSNGNPGQPDKPQNDVWFDPATDNKYFVATRFGAAELKEYRQYENEAAAIAKQIRDAQTRMKPDDPELRRLKADLEGAVQSAFQARQAAQSAQVERMRERLDKIEGRVKQRAKLAQEIVRRRVDELLNPEKQWDDTSTPDNVPTEQGPSTGEEPVSGHPAFDVESPVVDETSPTAPSAKRAPIAPAKAGEPRQVLLEAENTLLGAKAALTTRERALEGSEMKFARFQKLFEARAIEAAIVDEARNACERDRAELDAAKASVKTAERQLLLARDELGSQIRLLEIDLQDANLQLNQASNDEARAADLHKRAAIADNEYEHFVLALKQAQLKVERAQIRLDLYRKALPDGAPAGKTDDERSE